MIYFPVYLCLSVTITSPAWSRLKNLYCISCGELGHWSIECRLNLNIHITGRKLQEQQKSIVSYRMDVDSGFIWKTHLVAMHFEWWLDCVRRINKTLSVLDRGRVFIRSGISCFHLLRKCILGYNSVSKQCSRTLKYDPMRDHIPKGWELEFIHPARCLRSWDLIPLQTRSHGIFLVHGWESNCLWRQWWGDI